MGPPLACGACGCTIQPSAKRVTEISAISGRVLKDIITYHFWHDNPLMEALNKKHAALCKECLSLIEQIDAFEQSLTKTRENFEHRRSVGVRTNNFDQAKQQVNSGNHVSPQMKQEPEDWQGHEDFEWGRDDPNNYLDTTLQELEDNSHDNNGNYDDSNEEDEDYEFAPRGSRNHRGRIARGIRTPATEWSLFDACNAYPERQLTCPDRSVLGLDWFAEQRPKLEAVLTDLELDLAYFRDTMPFKISTFEESIARDIAIFRSESEKVESGLPGELNCFSCNKNFPTCLKKVQHVIECHMGNGRQFICGICSDYDDVDESSMFSHIFANHVVEDGASEKSKHGPRQGIKNESNQTYSCRFCPIVCRSELSYWFHWYTRHKKYRSRNCDLCGKSSGITTASLFRSHFLTDHCNFVYECYECSAQSTTADLFLIHLKDHEKARPSRGRKRNYPQERKSRAKKSSSGFRADDQNLSADDSASDPLTPILRAIQNPEICLEQSNEPLSSPMDQVPMEVWRDLLSRLETIKTMPSKIETDSVSLDWDVALFQMECGSESFGVPGERKCFRCGDFFPSKSEKHLHCITTHHSDPYYCAICEQAFSKETGGLNHMLTKHGSLWKTDANFKPPSDYVPCDECGLMCASKFALWYHKDQSHKKYNSVCCPTCEEPSNSFLDFLRHVLIKHGNYKYKCILCDKSSKSLETFKDHLKQHDRGRVKTESLYLDDDDEFFEREEIEINGKKILRKKIGKKGKKPPVACEICGTISKGAFNNARHLYTMHGIKREVQCDKCDTLCESVRAMLEHKKNHHSSASCHLCGKVFVEKGHLENHLMRHGIGKDGKNHQNDRDFMCEICSKTFTRKNYLVIHMKNHAEKSIKCTVCSKMFRWNSALQAHLTAAHNMGPKEGACTCEFCGRQFQDKSNYRQHRYTHMQVKPFNCETCGKGFIRRDLMKSHKEKCHASAPPFNMG